VNGKILYIHGFGSCGNGKKSRTLEQHFGSGTLLAPDLPVDPSTAIAALQALLDGETVELMVGSSLGGFYALHLNGLRERPIPAVLINPAIRPWITLAPHLGVHTQWCTGRPFELTADHVSQLEPMARQPDPALERYLVLLAEADEVLDSAVTARFFSAFEVTLEPEANHRFEHLAAHLPEITRFRAANAI